MRTRSQVGLTGARSGHLIQIGLVGAPIVSRIVQSRTTTRDCMGTPGNEHTFFDALRTAGTSTEDEQDLCLRDGSKAHPFGAT